jgi:hypothetical protein
VKRASTVTTTRRRPSSRRRGLRSDRAIALEWRKVWRAVLRYHRGDADRARRDLRDRLAIVYGPRFNARHRGRVLDGLALFVECLGTSSAPVRSCGAIMNTLERRKRTGARA